MQPSLRRKTKETAMADGGKGASPRPYSIDQTTFGSNWDAIFGKKNKSVIEEVSKLIAEETLQATDNRITGHSKEDQ
jgi:hypothetical protein